MEKRIYARGGELMDNNYDEETETYLYTNPYAQLADTAENIKRRQANLDKEKEWAQKHYEAVINKCSNLSANKRKRVLELMEN